MNKLRRNCTSSNEKVFAEEWFYQCWVNAEKSLESKWFRLQREFALELNGVQITPHENREHIAYNNFIALMWKKYYYVAMQ